MQKHYSSKRIIKLCEKELKIENSSFHKKSKVERIEFHENFEFLFFRRILKKKYIGIHNQLIKGTKKWVVFIDTGEIIVSKDLYDLNKNIELFRNLKSYPKIPQSMKERVEENIETTVKNNNRIKNLQEF